MKKYIITGGSSGMGYAIASNLIKNGNRVFILSRHAESCNLLEYKTCVAKNVDISQVKAINEFIDWYKKQSDKQPFDGLINCSGVGWGQPLATVEEKDYEKMFSLNVKGLIFVTKSIIPFIREQTGIICNFSSIAGIKGFADWSIYAASKFAVEGFTQSIRQELRPKGIRVVSIRPGSVDTPFYANLKPEEKIGFINPTTIANFVVNILDMPREAIVEDIFINNSLGDL